MPPQSPDVHQEARKRTREPAQFVPTGDSLGGSTVGAAPIPRFGPHTGALSPRQVIHLQRTAGNRAVARLLSKPVRYGPEPNAAHVQRADDRRVGARRTIKTLPSVAPSTKTAIQRAGNLDKFKSFLGDEWGQGGRWRDENKWAIDAIDPRESYNKHANKGGAWNKIKGVGAGIGHSLFGLPFAALGGVLSTGVRGLKTLGAGAYYGARGLGSLVGEGVSSLKSTAKDKKTTVWDPRSGDQQSGLLSNAGLGAMGGLSSVGSGVAGLTQKDLTVNQSLMDNDKSMLSNTTSSVGQGFGAGTGVIGGLSGMVNTGRGLSNIFGKKKKGKEYQRLTRGVGRTGAGLGQTFAGVTTAGKAISTLHNLSSPAAKFMASAALPAQAALSGVDLVRGIYGMGKAFKRQKNLRDLQHKFGDNEELSGMARMAKRYQTKRKRTAGINMAAGVIGGLGAGLSLSGVGAIAGLPLMAVAGLLKLGSSLYGTARDKTWGKDKAVTKKGDEQKWADYAAKNFKDENVKEILQSMGAEDIALDDEKLEKMNEDERRQVMLKQLMKR